MMSFQSRLLRRLIACALVGTSLSQASAADELEARLARLPRPWEKPIHRLTFEEYDATLNYWAKQHPQRVTLQKRGEAHNGMPIYLLKITDSNVPDADKQVVMISALLFGSLFTRSLRAIGGHVTVIVTVAVFDTQPFESLTV